MVDSNVPHTRGDEPQSADEASPAEEMFPTHVGMNRATEAYSNMVQACSPHTWG